MKIIATNARNRDVTLTRVPQFSLVGCRGVRPRDDDVGARFDQPQFGVPEFKILVDLANKGENSAALEGDGGYVVSGGEGSHGLFFQFEDDGIAK
ncbi:hypothetical protein Poly21_49450 [Allorhodopirellula heiligendammensis]|uniref:Uncharacterized protein n=1 Tax=Allorhodopirellula heiligendammensis TaxID=2714739 RepID=A0A5C6BG59_9BACT|nr:hypothetical protein Poly21_49450 [Allorhodopirellula heiligendammensis]